MADNYCAYLMEKYKIIITFCKIVFTFCVFYIDQ